jgi:hypothetical protein
MKILIGILLVVCGGVSLGQDPTLPSPLLFERFKHEPPKTTIPETPKQVSIKLKALVMLDQNRGLATLESNGQRYRIRLNRAAIVKNELGSVVRTNDDIQIEGVQYTVEDFSSRTIVLFDGQRRLLVQ